MSNRTAGIIDAEIEAIKGSNPNWLADTGDKALVAALTVEKNQMSAESATTKKKRIQISFLPSEFFDCPAEVRIFTMNEKTWRDVFKGHFIARLVTPTEEPVTDFDDMEDGGCYRAVRTFDPLLKSSQVDADVLEQEAALSLLSNISGNYPNCHLHQNVKLYENSSNKMAQQFDGILHGHLMEPTYAIIMEAKTSIHPNHFDEVLKKVAAFKTYVSEAPNYNFSTGWQPNKALSSFTHFSNVQHFIPCLAGRRFPENLVEECVVKGIMPVFPSGARYVAKGMELLRKVV
mmetsp:Transcript_26154/g.37448  ORF Transcript_26154/g.37448 Transcript_26154/m.37448 type:complete len:289 (+) Transcript_26154:30-896(+)